MSPSIKVALLWFDTVIVAKILLTSSNNTKVLCSDHFLSPLALTLPETVKKESGRVYLNAISILIWLLT